MSTDGIQYTVEKFALKYGLMMATGLVAFFLLMQLAGLAEILELRVLNIFILYYFILTAIKQYRKNHRFDITYFKGFGLGSLTGAVGALAFSIFIFIYINAIDPAFMDHIKRDQAFGAYLNPYLVSVTILFEGAFSGFLVSYGIMQYYKKSHMVNPLEE